MGKAATIDPRRYRYPGRSPFDSADLATDIESRVVAQGQQLKDLKADVEKLEAGQLALSSEMRAGFDRLLSHVSGANRPNWTAVGIGMSAVLALGAIYLRPLETRIDAQERMQQVTERMLTAGITSNRDSVQQALAEMRDIDRDSRTERITIRGDLERLAEKFREVETQFSWGEDVANMRATYEDKILFMLWNNQFQSAPMPAPTGAHFGPKGRD